MMKTIRILAILILTCMLVFASYVIVSADDNSCRDLWGFSYSLEFPPGYWSTGWHNYEFELTDPNGTEYTYLDFQVTEEADLVRGQVYLRFWTLRSAEGLLTEINPLQDTVMQVSWGPGLSYTEMKDFRSGTAVEVRWDGGDWISLEAGPLMNWCGYENNGHFLRSWGPKY
jgi:hypothetical protein